MTFASLAFGLALATQVPAGDCAFDGAPREAMTLALSGWARLDDQRIHAADPVQPLIQVFDLRCQYALTPASDGAFQVGGRRFDVRGFAHGGVIDVGDDDPFPVRKTSFASNAEDGGAPVFVISLPEVWAADSADQRDPTQLFYAVFMHEFGHVQHMKGLDARFQALEAAGYSAFALGDDVMQRTFGQDPEYLAAWRAEMAAFEAAATAPYVASVRAHLREGRDLMTARRARWLAGADRSGWADADDLFLTLEGAGQWAAYSWLTSADGQGLAPDAALQTMRTRWWSQEEGMMIMLALDRLTPDWPSLTFGPEGVTIDALLDRALDDAVEPAGA